MKHRIFNKKLFVPAAIAAMALGGCMTDRFDDAYIPDTGGGDEVTITVSIPAAQVPTTRSIDGAGGEAAVESVDVLVFKAGTPAGTPDVLVQHAKGQSLTQSTSSTDSYLVKFTARLTADAAATRVVLVANASDAADAAVAAAGGAGTALKTDVLSNLEFTSEGKWNAAGSSDYTPIPMYGEKAVSGISTGMKIDNVELVRMLARIDVVNNAAGFTLTDVYLVNRNAAGYIAPAWDASTGTILSSLPAVPTVPSGSQKTGQAQALAYTYVAGGLAGEIYTYEAVATSGVEGNATHTDAVCLILKGTYGGKTYYYRVDFTEGKDGAGKAPGDAGFNPATVKYMPVYRNHRYVFTIGAVRGIGYAAFDDALRSLGIMNNLRTSLLVVDESGIKNFVFNGEHYLGAGEDMSMDKASGSTANAAVTTNYAYGWQIDTGKGTSGIEYLSGSGWLSAVKDGAASMLSANLTVTALSANSGDERSAYVHLIAGRLTTKIKVTQAEGLPAMPDIPGIGQLIHPEKSYLGAFWRADQRGERLIRIPVTATGTGTWAVHVYNYGPDFAAGDILFSTAKTTDPGSPWSSNYSGIEAYSDPDGSTKRYVDDGSTHIVGNAPAVGDYIEFRVGLKQTFNPTAGKPARYAAIVISYNNDTKYQKIVLRQGEGADYLMRPGDAGIGVGGRTLAAKYSPYNLTAPDFNDPEFIMQSVNIGARGGTMTDYPSQAGAFFQWAVKSGGVPSVIAYSPKNPDNFGPLGWSYSNETTFWSVLESSYESCPPGYRRPTDGSATNTAGVDARFVGAANSEMGQSLFVDPATGCNDNSANSAWGYYADGFFDRRVIIWSTGRSSIYGETGYPDSAVGYNLSRVAYRGRLFYNPINNASLFFPASGFRDVAGGWLSFPGGHGCYWTSSSDDINNSDGSQLFFLSDFVSREYVSRIVSCSIRCVAE